MNLLFLSPSGGEIILVLVLVLMLFGSKKIPGLARGLGKGIRELKNATGDIQREINSGMSEDLKKIKDIRDKADISKEIKKNLDI